MTSDQWLTLRYVCGWIKPEDPEFASLGERMDLDQDLRDDLADFVATFPAISSASGPLIYDKGVRHEGISEALLYIQDPVFAEAAMQLFDRLKDLETMTPTMQASAKIAERGEAEEMEGDPDANLITPPPADFASDVSDRVQAGQVEEYTLDLDDAFLNGDNPLGIEFTSTPAERLEDEGALREMCRIYGYRPDNEGIHFGNVLAYAACVFEAGRQLERGELKSLPKSRFVVETLDKPPQE